jgi:hypothetical protein
MLDLKMKNNFIYYLNLTLDYRKISLYLCYFIINDISCRFSMIIFDSIYFIRKYKNKIITSEHFPSQQQKLSHIDGCMLH